MIIWIDGTHGVGKTTITEALMTRMGSQKAEHLDSDGLDDSVYEAMIQHGGGCQLQDNLSFLNAFREEIDRKISEGCDLLIVEMALTQKECIQHLLDPLSAKYQLIHIILTASVETITARIENDSDRDKNFALNHMVKNIKFLEQNYPEALYIDTEHMSISAVCDAILAACKT